MDGQDLRDVVIGSYWIPAFAGMTEKRVGYTAGVGLPDSNAGAGTGTRFPRCARNDNDIGRNEIKGKLMMAYAGLDLTGRKALVTGAARGIGATLAVGLAQAGADVAVCDLASDESWEGLADTVWKIRNEGQVGLAVDLDVQEVEEIRPAIRQVERDLGGLDILVNNAGIRRRAPALEVTEEDWDAVMDTNLKGAFFCAQAAARLMIPQGYGRIINIASQMALVGATNRAAYCASKGGLLNLTRVLALEWAQHGITVNAIGPGPTLTPGVVEAETNPSTVSAWPICSSRKQPQDKRPRS